MQVIVSVVIVLVRCVDDRPVFQTVGFVAGRELLGELKALQRRHLMRQLDDKADLCPAAGAEPEGDWRRAVGHSRIEFAG